MLEQTTGRQIDQTVLGSYEADDDLWKTLSLDCNAGKTEVIQQAGPLGQNKDISRIELVIIPDLTSLSLAGSRACVMLIGADVAHLERHGLYEKWHPENYFLAGCAGNETGRVSPHLLDRFALRLNGKQFEKKKPMNTAERLAAFTQIISDPVPSKSRFLGFLSDSAKKPLQKAVQQQPEIENDAIQRIQDYFLPSETYGMRREIALLRLAKALSGLGGSDAVKSHHVNEAARIIGLKQAAPSESPIHSDNTRSSEDNKPKSPNTPAAKFDPNPSASTASGQPVYESEPAMPIEPIPFSMDTEPGVPYPEDTAPVEREPDSLRLPLRRARAATAAYGQIIGTEHTACLHDIAIVSTLLEALKFQAFRRKKYRITDNRLILAKSDLRKYRRMPLPEQILVWVLDYTCLRDCLWEDAVLPYLRWAYVEHTSVCLIQVGAEIVCRQDRVTEIRMQDIPDPEELRAKRITAHSILSPLISAALEAKPGRATPLAHGLDLAFHTLCHTLQHGKSAVQRALLLILSDGRGNVPLDASHTGKITSQVMRKGVEDALEAAQNFRRLKNLKIVLFNPQPQQHAELPVELAEAMGAEIVDIPLKESEN